MEEFDENSRASAFSGSGSSVANEFSYQIMLTSSSEEEMEEDYDEIPSFSDIDVEPSCKKIRQESTPTPPPIQPKFERCKTCHQIIEDLPVFDKIKFSSYYRNEILSEIESVKDPRICIEGMDDDQLPDYLLNEFSFYDKEDHLVALDANLVEKGKEIRFSGVVKSDFKDNPGIPVLNAGPITGWWITGFLPDETMKVAVSTNHGQYWLNVSSDLYQDIYHVLSEKASVTKIIYTCLRRVLDSEEDENYNYDDLIDDFQNSSKNELFEQDLLNCGKFVVERIQSFEQAAAYDEETPILYNKAFKQLARNSNADGFSNAISRKKRKDRARKRGENRSSPIDYYYSSSDEDSGKARGKAKARDRRPKKPPLSSTRATTTPLVAHFFESIFGTEMEKKSCTKSIKGCGKCPPCQAIDCGSCSQCLKMKKFSGDTNDHFLVCDRRQCDNSDVKMISSREFLSPRKREKSTKIIFLSEDKIGEKDNASSYFTKVQVNEDSYSIGDFAEIFPEDSDSPSYICKIIAIINEKKLKVAHVRWFARGENTIFGDMADPKEVFAVYDCEDIELYRFIKPLHIQYSPVPDNWSSLGGTTESIVTPTTHIGGQDQILWYRKLYDPDTAGFLEVPPILLHDDDGITCFTCSHFESEFNNQTPIFEESSNTFVYKQQTFTKKCAVMLTPNSFNLTFRKKKGKIRNVEAKDPNLYPEYWNKKKKKSKLEVSDPFDIGIIEDMYVDQGKKVMVRVRCMYRPENIGYDWEEIVKQDINKVYWTESKVSLSAKNIEGLCHVELRSNITEKEPFLWSQKGLFKFYYEEAFNIESNQLEPLNEEAKNYAQPSDSNQDFPTLERPLNMLDVFSGCGGLSIGLEQSGVAKCRWAIEWDADAAQAFKTNHSEDCKVVVDDVNKVLREIIDQGDGDDERANSRKEKQLPKKGEVDLMCGGPPCQGFSVMNTFHESDKARFKNSLIATYLSFCDYFRPSYFILENVKNFAQFNGGRILILCMRALVMMGYQCQFGVLQAGNFGVAQNRKRAILLAAAPNCPLPHFPAIMNVFEQMPLTINVDDKSFDVNSNHWRNNSAPYRNMTARDAISDLTDTNKGGQKVLCDDPVTWLQRTIRWCHKKQAYISQVSHHEEKGTSEIVMARIACIPKTLGADWRDLPNKCVDLPSGRKATKIKYPYIDIKTKKPAVCSCSTKQGQCRVMDRQDYTLIPFALVHKAKNHSQWKNCYGRVHWDTYFSTTTTNIHPEGKQGRVLHPEQDRVLSVRECARSQGFPDYAEFCGSIHDKYKQIGNAVPPPMARALGISILCAQAETESLKLLY